MEHRQYQVFTSKTLDRIPGIAALPADQRDAIRATAQVFPFRVNNYVVDELIRWGDVPNDPFFQLTIPQPGMLQDEDLSTMLDLLRREAEPAEITAAARTIQLRLNPHPAGQRELNVPEDEEGHVEGMQHKYRETALFFPSRGQTCHAYCTYCFRWAQFVGLEDLKFANREATALADYCRQHHELSDVLITGGDPMIMKASHMRAIIEPLLQPEFEHIRNIRIGTKSLAWWPYRFTTDKDADEMLRLFEDVVQSGRQLALMAHYSHPRELEAPVAKDALRRVLGTGAVVRCQAPLIRHVNDDAAVWAELWRREVALGAVPYYMFVERDTGARHYFEVPLARAHRIFSDAYRQVSGLARTVRGPSMSSTPGKIVVQGTTEVRGERVFVLQFLQARNPDWVGRPFFAKFDPKAAWLDHLQPAFGEERFFFEAEQLPIQVAPQTARQRSYQANQADQANQANQGTDGYPDGHRAGTMSEPI